MQGFARRARFAAVTARVVALERPPNARPHDIRRIGSDDEIRVYAPPAGRRLLVTIVVTYAYRLSGAHHHRTIGWLPRPDFSINAHLMRARRSSLPDAISVTRAVSAAMSAARTA